MHDEVRLKRACSYLSQNRYIRIQPATCSNDWLCFVRQTLNGGLQNGGPRFRETRPKVRPSGCVLVCNKLNAAAARMVMGTRYLHGLRLMFFT